MSAPQEFHYHRGVAPMMWVLFALSLIELIAVHLLVTLTWPWVGWPLTIASAIGAILILLWIRPFRDRPHILTGEHLRLRLGMIKSIELDVSEIARVRRGWEQGALESRGIINLAGIAFPNRCLELTEPLVNGRNRVFIRLDAPEAFDAALAERGVAFD